MTASAADTNDKVMAADPFSPARRKLFPPLRNRILAQAADALVKGRLDIAESLVSRFLRNKPDHPDALSLLANIARRAGRLEEAVAWISRCIELVPQDASCRYTFALVLRDLEKSEQSLAQVDLLLSADPRNPLFRDLRATLLRMLGRHDEAVETLRGLSEDFPQSPAIWLQYGRALKVIGADKLCITACRRAIELKPSLVAAYSTMATLKTYRFSGAETERMERLFTLPALAASERADLHSSLGKAYEDEGQCAKAFDNYAKGNALRRLGAEFDSSRFTRYRANCELLFTRSFFHERTGIGCKARDPIFIVSMPRSGSTLVEQILSSHSAIEGLGELTDLDVVVGRMLAARDGRRPPHEFWIDGWFEFRTGLVENLAGVLNAMTRDEFCVLGEEYLQAVSSRRIVGRPMFTDKALHNFGHVGLIHLILPNAKIIDVRRHPLDCGWSCFKSHFPGGQPFSERLNDIGSHYANYVRLMAHFDRVLPARVHRIIYEELVADPETELRRLFSYLELPFETQCLRFHENKRPVGTLSSQQVRSPLNLAGLNQWRAYEPWLGTLKSALGTIVDVYPKVPDEDLAAAYPGGIHSTRAPAPKVRSIPFAANRTVRTASCPKAG
ncbi:MAG TPA: sulfotransferase [Rhizomicrobium sp.]|jgi:tetratricopeptide (TPR) repeat protein|nr:sulfotransferase [Rhizomicrobium sp.]